MAISEKVRIQRRAQRARRRALGLCIRCPGKLAADSISRCNACLTEARETQGQRNARRDRRRKVAA